jgi:predicted nuclease of restriction endonuclease-like (RecB) superfamily
MTTKLSKTYAEFIHTLKQEIATARTRAYLSVNKEMIMLYWRMGSQILERQDKEGWGAKVIESISKDLQIEFPGMKGFGTRNLKYMRKFAEEYSDQSIVQEMLAQLSWYHNLTLLDKVHSSQERLFYINKTLENGWSRNVMVLQIERDLYNRQSKAITNSKDKLPEAHSDLAQNTLKDPYLFDFLTIGEKFQEKEIENELVKHIEKFLLELGAGFAFVGRQYKLSIGEEDYFIDLLFYNFKIRSFVVVELKSGAFKPEHTGKLNFYLSAVDDILKHKDDNPSIGLLLCKDKGERIKAEYALRDINKPIGLAEYQIVENLPEHFKTSLPSIEELEVEFSSLTMTKETTHVQ